MKVPTELLRHDLDLNCPGSSPVPVQRSPHALAQNPQADENHSGHHRPDDFEPVVPVRVGGALSAGAVAELPNHPTQSDLSGSERDSHHYNGEHELAINPA